MLPRCLGVGGGGAYHTRVPLLIGMLKLSACAGCADARAVIWGMRKALAAIAVSFCVSMYQVCTIESVLIPELAAFAMLASEDTDAKLAAPSASQLQAQKHKGLT